MNTKYQLISFKLWVKLDFIKKKQKKKKNYILVKENSVGKI